MKIPVGILPQSLSARICTYTSQTFELRSLSAWPIAMPPAKKKNDEKTDCADTQDEAASSAGEETDDAPVLDDTFLLIDPVIG